MKILFMKTSITKLLGALVLAATFTAAQDARAAVCNCAACAVLGGTHQAPAGSFILATNIEVEGHGDEDETAWNLALSYGITERVAFSLYARTAIEERGLTLEAIAPSMQFLLHRFEAGGREFHLHLEVGGQIAPQGEEDEENPHAADTSVIASHERSLFFARLELDTKIGTTLFAAGFLFTQYTEGDRETRPGYSARMLTELAEKTLFGIEVGGDIGAGRGYHEAAATIYHQLTEKVQLHFGGSYGISEDSPVRAIRAGFSVRI